ncbi:hypothetical protein [Nonomuraea rubra]|uniref:hypothetical protein n=1 Tax=Nonomuraea rubra TaxID=46180 RepID=UPI0031F006E0
MSRELWPPMTMSPEVGSIRRLIMRMVVVLPQPDGPSRTTISPAGMFRSSSCTAGSPPPGKRLGDLPQLDRHAAGGLVSHGRPPYPAW